MYVVCINNCYTKIFESIQEAVMYIEGKKRIIICFTINQLQGGNINENQTT